MTCIGVSLLMNKARGSPDVPGGGSGALLLSFRRGRPLEPLGLESSRSPDGSQCANWPTDGGRPRGATECRPCERSVAAEGRAAYPVSYTHLRAHETGRNLVC